MNIEKFKNAIGGGVRNALFRVRGNIGTTTSPDTLSFLVTATNLPVSNLDTIETNYRGRTIKLPGSRKFDDWSVTILNDENMELRTLFRKVARRSQRSSYQCCSKRYFTDQPC